MPHFSVLQYPKRVDIAENGHFCERQMKTPCSKAGLFLFIFVC